MPVILSKVMVYWQAIVQLGVILLQFDVRREAMGVAGLRRHRTVLHFDGWLRVNSRLRQPPYMGTYKSHKAFVNGSQDLIA